MKGHHHIFAVSTMCCVFGVSASGYYGWTQCPESKRRKQNRELKEQIKKLFNKSHAIYGSPRITAELQQMGIPCSRSRTARLMRELGLRAKAARKFYRTTDSKHNDPVAPNLLGQIFCADEPNEVWTSDITSVRTAKGWLYLTVMLDLFSSEIIGYAKHKMIQSMGSTGNC